MDDAFSDFIMKKISEPELEKRLADFLSAVTKKKIEVGIAPNTGKEPFFGMRIFPMPDQMDAFLKGMEAEEKLTFNSVYNSWKSIGAWFVEIDAQVFDRRNIGFIPEELSALCLHEFGHTIYSESVIERYYHAYREYDIRLSDEDKASKKILYILNKIPLMLACGAHMWKTGKNNVGEEIFADTTVERLGYGEYLLSAFNKIIKAFGNDTGYTDEGSLNSAIKESIIWCNLNTHDLIKRRNNLKNELYYQTIKSDSGFLKKIVYSIMQTIGVKAKEKYTGAIATESFTLMATCENFLDQYELIFDIKSSGFFERHYNDLRRRAAIATESTSSSKKYKEPTQLDIDAIYVEVDRISNHMDRRYVLDLIYNQIEQIERFKELFPYNHDLKRKYEDKMVGMLNQLESLRQVVLGKRSFDKSYKVFVKYPPGYEG
jgi:hypothetical protein